MRATLGKRVESGARAFRLDELRVQEGLLR
jgi:hypothetical protein